MWLGVFSGPRYQLPNWRNGRRGRLKIYYPYGCPGSSPGFGIRDDFRHHRRKSQILARACKPKVYGPFSFVSQLSFATPCGFFPPPTGGKSGGKNYPANTLSNRLFFTGESSAIIVDSGEVLQSAARSKSLLANYFSQKNFFVTCFSLLLQIICNLLGNLFLEISQTRGPGSQKTLCIGR